MDGRKYRQTCYKTKPGCFCLELTGYSDFIRYLDFITMIIRCRLSNVYAIGKSGNTDVDSCISEISRMWTLCFRNISQRKSPWGLRRLRRSIRICLSEWKTPRTSVSLRKVQQAWFVEMVISVLVVKGVVRVCNIICFRVTFRLYFFIVAQIAWVASSIWIAGVLQSRRLSDRYCSGAMFHSKFISLAQVVPGPIQPWQLSCKCMKVA